MKFLFTSVLISCLYMCSAQNEQAFGDSLFTHFKNDQKQWQDWFITLETYHTLIARQRLEKSVQDDFMLSINESYDTQLQSFVSTMEEVQGMYNTDEDDNSYYELTSVSIKPLEDIKLVYFFRLNLSYHWKKGEDNYVIEFQACYLNKTWHMMEPFQEYYE